KADYMHAFGVDTVADVARTLAMFGAFTEGMALFASFAMLLNFPRHNKMNGMGQIVSWSVRDESLHCEGIIKLYHEWHRETGAVTGGVADDIIDVARTMVGRGSGSSIWPSRLAKSKGCVRRISALMCATWPIGGSPSSICRRCSAVSRQPKAATGRS